MNINLENGTAFLDNFPTRSGITLNVFGDFGNSDQNGEITRNNILKNKLGINWYHKMLMSGNVKNNEIVFSENCGSYCYCGAIISFSSKNAPEALFSTTADSPIIVLTARDRKLIAIIHSSWCETEKNIVEKTINVIKEEYGIKGPEISAGVFPGICSQCNIVGENVGKKFPSAYNSANGQLDLCGIIDSQICEAGIPRKEIRYGGLCSFHSKNEAGEPILFSYRRDKTEKRNCVFIAR
jgi:hypothetical protein